MIKAFFKKYAVYFQRFIGTYELVKVQTIQQKAEYRRLRDEMRIKFPENPALFGKKVYSQTDEDGIIEAIFNLIPNDRTFLEIGIQTGVECNTHYLLLKGWRGTWVEGSDKFCKIIEKNLGGVSFKNHLNVVNAFVDCDNIVKIFQDAHNYFNVKELDFFSLDIDGNDFYILETLFKNEIYPKVLCVEYNAKFAPPLDINIKYNKNHIWDYSDYLGCSLQCYTNLFIKHNYTLISCNLPGINAFFVRNEYSSLFAKYSIDDIYQPYRYYLSPIPLAQIPSLKYLRDKLEKFNMHE